jgi:hypothetical protein
MTFDDPDEVLTQLKTLAWILSNMDPYGTLCDEYRQGLYMLTSMIADNVESMAAKLKN